MGTLAFVNAFVGNPPDGASDPQRASNQCRWMRIAVSRAQIFTLAALSFSGMALSGQTGASVAVVTLGAPPPVAGREFTVYAMVMNPAITPAPTGSIQFDFGDGTAAVSVPMTYRAATTTHTYTAVGASQMTATYSGDANFAPASAQVKGQILSAVTPVTLNVYGDSISASGDTVSATSTNWVPIVPYVHGWKLNNSAAGGDKVSDQCPFMYGTPITPSSYSAVLVGQNDFGSGDAVTVAQYESAMLACTAWLLIPSTAVDGTIQKSLRKMHL